MTLAQLCINAYLTVGAVAAAVIWVVLIASNQRDDTTQENDRDHSR